MNAGGHIAVVARAFADRPRGLSGPRVGAEHASRLLGSALPDLAAMGRFRLLGDTVNAGVTDGIKLHHRTDDLFHRHPWFRERNRRLTAELSERGLGRGPAMACSHVGIELLLDGRLLADPTIASASADAFESIRSVHHELDTLVVPSVRQAWLDHLDLVARRRLPADYADPTAVARRLHRILAARPRLALAEDEIAVVAEALSARNESIAASALDLVTDLASSLER